MKLRHYLSILLSLIVVYGLINIIGVYVFELVIVAYFFMFFLPSVVLLLISTFSLKKDTGVGKFIDILGITISLSSIAITVMYFIYAWYTQ